MKRIVACSTSFGEKRNTRKASLCSKCLVLAIGLLVVGCNIDNLTGPTLVSLGATATYSMRLLTDGWDGANLTPVVAMDVPIGWTLTSSSYTGTANGAPVSGSGTIVGTDPTGCNFAPATSAGYQRIFLSTAPIPTVVGTDSATVSVTFYVGGAPGNYTLSFWHGGHTVGSICQGPPTTIAVSVTGLTSPMPFVAVAPCRVADTRASSPFPTGVPPTNYGPPGLSALETRSYTIGGQCGIPATAQAVSFLITAVNFNNAAGAFRAFPVGSDIPTVGGAVVVWAATTPGAVVDAVVVPVGGAGAQLNVNLNGSAMTDLVLDVNGYYAPAGIVNSLNALNGDLTLAQGTNVTITPSGGNTLTISSTGGGPAGPTGPTGPAGPAGPAGPTTSTGLTSSVFMEGLQAIAGPLHPFVPLTGLIAGPGETANEVFFPATCLASLRAGVDQVTGGATPITFTLRVNGSDTAATCVLATNATSCSSITPAAIAAGDLAVIALSGPADYGSARTIRYLVTCQ